MTVRKKAYSGRLRKLFKGVETTKQVLSPSDWVDFDLP